MLSSSACLRESMLSKSLSEFEIECSRLFMFFSSVRMLSRRESTDLSKE